MGRARGEERANALWGGGKRMKTLFATLAVAALALLGALAQPAAADTVAAYTSPGLLDEASASPDKVFRVIVQARRGRRADEVAGEVTGVRKEAPSARSLLKRTFRSVAGVSAELTGKQILRLARRPRVESITRDTPIEAAAYSSSQIWTEAAGVASGWTGLSSSLTYPTIAVVDSGVSGSLPTFSGRFLGNVHMVSNSTTSGAYGHGSFVASIAAGAEAGYTGAEPRARVISLKVLDGAGVGSKSDVIAAADWILQNRAAYNIRVANFSLNTGGDSVEYDALDRAVESLWLNGIVVVVAAGNYAADGARSDVGYAPANDPFVITVGASDTMGTPSRGDDTAAPWSAWGYTQDGFFKPEVAAPGRYLVGAVPSTAKLLTQFPERQVAPNYMWMSGTSFAAPVVSGIAASILATNPSWTPDQVKGAIMQTVTVPAGYGSDGALGVGVVDGQAALAAPGTANPNAGLLPFVSQNGATGLQAFDASAWRSYAAANASWANASWSSASWANASWSSASWSSASWSSASWANASWANASWANASWANAYDHE
jgi:serine protease AprX